MENIYGPNENVCDFHKIILKNRKYIYDATQFNNDGILRCTCHPTRLNLARFLHRLLLNHWAVMKVSPHPWLISLAFSFARRKIPSS